MPVLDRGAKGATTCRLPTPGKPLWPHGLSGLMKKGQERCSWTLPGPRASAAAGLAIERGIEQLRQSQEPEEPYRRGRVVEPFPDRGRPRPPRGFRRCFRLALLAPMFGPWIHRLSLWGGGGRGGGCQAGGSGGGAGRAGGGSGRGGGGASSSGGKPSRSAQVRPCWRWNCSASRAALSRSPAALLPSIPSRDASRLRLARDRLWAVLMGESGHDRQKPQTRLFPGGSS
jgi:hypothetical protein